MPLLFYLPLIIWMGLFELARDEMRVPLTNGSTTALNGNRFLASYRSPDLIGERSQD
jgi:hypothetical protein